MHEDRFETIDAETLMNMRLLPVNFVVDTLLAQGLHLLAGAPKVGKSWLALWLALMVAKGEDIWGLSVRQGTTLYLCLEDNRERIQSRLYEITDYAPPCLMICHNDSSTIGGGLEKRIGTFVTEHPDTRLIIIDTLQMVRRAGLEANYANDYRELSSLKKLADHHGIAILLIHHLRKEESPDLFNRISGTTAIQGAVDSSFTLVEDRRGSGIAKLTCVGRDIEYREMELKLGEERVWELLGDSFHQPAILQDNIVQTLLTFMEERDAYRGTPTELADALSTLSGDSFESRSLIKRLNKNRDSLAEAGFTLLNGKSNGTRFIEIRRNSGDRGIRSGFGSAPPQLVPVVPVGVMEVK